MLYAMAEFKKQVIPRRWIKITSFEEYANLVEDIAKYPRVVFDTETTGLTMQPETEIFGASFGVGDKTCERCYWFNFHEIENPDLQKAIIDVVRYLFQSGEKIIIMHNGTFDMKMVRKCWGIEFTHDKINDSFTLAMVLHKKYEGWKNSGLKDLTRILLKRRPVFAEIVDTLFEEMTKVSKEEWKMYHMIPTELVFAYACEDAENTFDVFYKVLAYYANEKEGLQNTYRLEREFTKVLAEIEYWGMQIDYDYFVKMRDTLEPIVRQYEQQFRDRWMEDWCQTFNKKEKDWKGVNAGQQLSKIMFHADMKTGLHIDPAKAQYTPKGEFKTDKHYLASFEDVPEMKEILDYREKNTALTKVKSIIDLSVLHEDGTRTIHSGYWPMVDTGRISSTGKDDVGTNLQNIQNDKVSTPEQQKYSIRRGFSVPEGMLYVTMDFKSFEVAVLANASQDPKLVEDVINGVDFHSTIGSIAFDRPYSDLVGKVDTLAVEQRTHIKRTSFLFIYGGGVKHCAESQKMSIELAQRIKDSIEIAYPDMVRWRYDVQNYVERTGKVYTLCGRMRRVDPKNAYRHGVNTVCQGTAADILKYGHVDLHKLLRGRKTRQVATVHDEIHFYIDPSEADLVPEIVRCLETQRLEVPRYVPVRVEMSMGPNWADMKGCELEDIDNKLREMRDAKAQNAGGTSC